MNNATYTAQLRFLIQNLGREEVESWFKNYELTDYLTPEQIEVIEEAGIWSKDKLASKIVDHYYMREIGYETDNLFKHFVKVYMNEIMESKLPLIYSNSIEYDPLVNVDYTETYNREIGTTGNNSSTSSNNASGLSVNSDSPQGQINKTEILQGRYATNTGASESESTINDESESTTNTDENYTKRVKGNSGVSATAQKMIEQYRQNIVAIDKDIIEEVGKLFMGIY